MAFFLSLLDNFVDNLMVSNEKTPTPGLAETVETQEQMEDLNIPYMSEFELEVDNLGQTQDPEILKSKLQKKKRGRRSKKEMI